MICRNCGTTVPEGSAFCLRCGASMDDLVNLTSKQPLAQPMQTVPVVMLTQQLEPVKGVNGMAKAGFILGIFASLFSLCTISVHADVSFLAEIMTFFIFPLATLGTIFSSIGISRRRLGSKGIAIAGLVLSISSFIIPFIVLGSTAYK